MFNLLKKHIISNFSKEDLLYAHIRYETYGDLAGSGIEPTKRELDVEANRRFNEIRFNEVKASVPIKRKNAQNVITTGNL